MVALSEMSILLFLMKHTVHTNKWKCTNVFFSFLLYDPAAINVKYCDPFTYFTSQSSSTLELTTSAATYSPLKTVMGMNCLQASQQA